MPCGVHREAGAYGRRVGVLGSDDILLGPVTEVVRHDARARARGLLDDGCGRAHEAALLLDEAGALFARLNARPWRERCDRALAQPPAA
jgi:hypothetical protein